VLSFRSAEWREKPAYVARVSAVLLKRYPILKRDVRTIPDKELKRWVEAVREAGAVADPALVELLKPALEDKRQARINYGAGGWNEGRVCDRALRAILQILDGDSWIAFEAAGIKSYTEEERVETHDRVIGILKDRLKSLPAKK
jgi:HEAT repeat protein